MIWMQFLNYAYTKFGPPAPLRFTVSRFAVAFYFIEKVVHHTV
jgi:hypothetical protein